jgi:aspartokinase/homoserine dehydrogenase 1
MKVLKFGGTSVGTPQSILNVKQIVEAAQGPVVVVVSAVGGVTDLLIQTSKMAAQGNEEYRNLMVEVRKRHYSIIDFHLNDGAIHTFVKNQVESLLKELDNIFTGIYLVHDLSSKTSDLIVSYGERLSSFILSYIIKGAELKDARDFIKTNRLFSKHEVNKSETETLIQAHLKQHQGIALVPGFIASDTDTSETSNLGRGGSDYTAALIAAALEAKTLEIWTDVDGFMTADPRVISSAYVIESLSYVEAMELCNFGAKVVYPPTIYPAFHKNIPILIKNTFNAKAEGTLITHENKPTTKAIKGISSINDTSLITVRGLGMVGVIGVNYRIFKALAKNGISVFLVSQASSENSTSIGVRNDEADLACRVLSEEFKSECELGELDTIVAERNLATVAVVGENMKHTPGIAGRLFGTLGRNGINVIACAQGASETNISFVVEKRLLRKTLNVIHDSFFLSEFKVLNLFICGVGTVGDRLLQQIQQQKERLKVERGLDLKVIGIANSKRFLIQEKGIELNAYKEELMQAKEGGAQELCQEIIHMNIFNAVFVDCTANSSIANLYQSLLSHNVSVVAANKVAASSSYSYYNELKQTAFHKGVKFLFETNVGAGLPIINTMNDLRNSGDKIVKIEAVLSGTLNYIFNELSVDISLSNAVYKAMDEGYSEPDPRLDLSGQDVVRKLVILAREAGYKVEQEDIIKRLFIPNDFFEGELDHFWKQLSSLDASFEAKRKALEKTHKCWRFVAKWENGVGSVGLKEIETGHPFYSLEGSNNVVLLTTERYHTYPMIIQGYGAGADVTAAGVFADIMSIANI